MSSDDKAHPGNSDEVKITDPDLPGLSSVFSTTQAGLKPLRRRARNSGEVKSTQGRTGDGDPAVDDAAEPPGAAAPVAEVRAGGSGETHQLPPDHEAFDVPEAGVNPTVDGIQLRAGLSLVDTAELPAHRPPPAEADENGSAAADPPSTAATAAGTAVEPPASPAPPAEAPATGPPIPRPRSTPRASSAQRNAALFDDEPSSARRNDIRPAGSSSNWLLYMIVLVVAVGLIGALLVTVLEL